MMMAAMLRAHTSLFLTLHLLDSCGASRLVCKTFWDYKMILKFEDHDSIVNYMENHNDAINEAFLPRIQALAVGEVKQQNFVYDDIE